MTPVLHGRTKRRKWGPTGVSQGHESENTSVALWPVPYHTCPLDTLGTWAQLEPRLSAALWTQPYALPSVSPGLQLIMPVNPVCDSGLRETL